MKLAAWSLMSATLQPSPGWIINRNQDLLWFVGSGLAGYALLLVIIAFGGMPVRVGVLLAFTLDGPHVFSTVTRAVFDRTQRRTIGRLWLVVIPLCAIGPAMTLAGYYLPFFLMVMAWGHYHIAKQHMGMVFLYRRKALQRDGLRLDKWATLITFSLPFVYYLSVVITGSTQYLPLFLIPALIVAGFYALRVREVSPKVLLLAVHVPVAWAAYIYAAGHVGQPGYLLAALVVTNAGHSLQYLRLMWFHNHNRYAARSGLAGLLSRRWLYFFGACFILSFPSRLAAEFGHVAASAALGFVMMHYLLDGKLWRVRGDKELAEALKL